MKTKSAKATHSRISLAQVHKSISPNKPVLRLAKSTFEIPVRASYRVRRLAFSGSPDHAQCSSKKKMKTGDQVAGTTDEQCVECALAGIGAFTSSG
jgi:hypothetical protein